MDRLDVIVVYRNLPIGGAERAEPVVNGERLADTVQRVGGDPSPYAGMEDERWLTALREQQDARARVKVLGCGCGVDGCASVSVEIFMSESEVIWRDFRASGGNPDLSAAIGPFHFDRSRYARAIARPIRGEDELGPPKTRSS